MVCNAKNQPNAAIGAMCRDGSWRSRQFHLWELVQLQALEEPPLPLQLAHTPPNFPPTQTSFFAYSACLYINAASYYGSQRCHTALL